MAASTEATFALVRPKDLEGSGQVDTGASDRERCLSDGDRKHARVY